MTLTEHSDSSGTPETPATHDDAAQGTEALDDARPTESTDGPAPIYDEVVAELGDPAAPPA